MKSAVSRRRFRTPGSPLIMQKFLSNLLIFFALSLCALCAFQWVREAQLKRTEADVTRLDSLRVELSGLIKTNKEEIQALTKHTQNLEKEIEAQKAQTARYKDAFEKANERLKQQN